MELVYAFLAQAADLNRSGQFFVFNGGVDLVLCEELPTVLSSLTLVAKFRIGLDERKKHHRVLIQSKGPDGSSFIPDQVFPIEPLPEPPEGALSLYKTMIFNTFHVVLENISFYKMTLEFGAGEILAASFQAIPAHESPRMTRP